MFSQVKRKLHLRRLSKQECKFKSVAENAQSTHVSRDGHVASRDGHVAPAPRLHPEREIATLVSLSFGLKRHFPQSLEVPPFA